MPGSVAMESVPIVFDNVQCNGDETQLIDCSRAMYVEGCDHSYDAGVNCTATGKCTNVKLMHQLQTFYCTPQEMVNLECKCPHWSSLSWSLAVCGKFDLKDGFLKMSIIINSRMST